MNVHEWHLRRMKIYCKMAMVIFVIFIVFSKYLRSSPAPDPVVKEFTTTATVLSVSADSPDNGGFGSNLTFATVQLDTGEKAFISLTGNAPSLGEHTMVQVSKFSSGKTRVVAHSDY